MDNGDGVSLNLNEVMAFGEKGETPSSELHCCLGFIIYEKKCNVYGAGVNVKNIISVVTRNQPLDISGSQVSEIAIFIWKVRVEYSSFE